MTWTQHGPMPAEPQEGSELGHFGKEREMKPRILIVDDDEINIEVLSKLLQDEYELATAYTGEECLDKIEVFAPDVVLLDIMMPGLDGYETCRRVKSCPSDDVAQVILGHSRADVTQLYAELDLKKAVSVMERVG